jgi:ABC-type transporter Mla MlaB component
MSQPLPPLPVPLSELLEEILGRPGDALGVVSWSSLDQARLRVLMAPSRRPGQGWNRAFCAHGERTVLLASLHPDLLHLAPVGELRGEAVRNLGDALLEGLEEGCARFLLDFSRVRSMDSQALDLLLRFRRELHLEGRLDDLELRAPPDICQGVVLEYLQQGGPARTLGLVRP